MNTGNLVLYQQHPAVFDHSFHALSVGNKVGRDVALVELHALGELEFHRCGARLFNRNHAVLANLVESISDKFTNLAILRRYGRNIGDFILAGYRARDRDELFGHRDNGLVDTALNIKWRRASGHHFETFANHGLC